MNKNILFALKTEKSVMFIILTLIVLVAAFADHRPPGARWCAEKRKEIGILKADRGVSGKSITAVFFAVGMTIGLLGTLSREPESGSPIIRIQNALQDHPASPATSTRSTTCP